MEKHIGSEIKISDLLKEKYINLDLKSNTKKEVIEELSHIVAQSSKLTNRKAFVKAILEREELGSTGIGSGVALPHSKTNVAKNFILVFGRKNEGLDFGALDGENTFLFFILASPKEEVGMHLKILAEISYIVRDKFIIELLKKAQDKKEVLKIISEAEKNRKK